jgi:hypothetical protein
MHLPLSGSSLLPHLLSPHIMHCEAVSNLALRSCVLNPTLEFMVVLAYNDCADICAFIEVAILPLIVESKLLLCI